VFLVQIGCKITKNILYVQIYLHICQKSVTFAAIFRIYPHEKVSQNISLGHWSILFTRRFGIDERRYLGVAFGAERSA
jgi:hypothetical protein